MNMNGVIEQDLIFPIQVKKMNDEATKEYHRKKLYDLSKLEGAKLDFKVDGSVWKDGKPIAEEPTDEQKRWVLGSLKAPANTREAFNQ